MEEKGRCDMVDGGQVEGIRSLSEIKLISKVKKKNKEGKEESCPSRWKFRLVKSSR